MTAPLQSVVVKEFQDADRARWDAFVEAHPEATFFHLSGWRQVIAESFGHEAPYLYAERGGEIVGVLPLVRIRSLLFGHSLISGAFAVHGGPVGTGEEALLRLDAAALALAARLNVNHVEYRAATEGRPGWIEKSGTYATFRRAIDPDPEKNLAMIPRKQRAVVRQSLGKGLEARVVGDVDVNWRLYAISLRNLGTPTFPRRYFASLKRQFGDACEILDIYHDGEPLAGCLTFRFRDQILPYYAGGVPEARKYGAHDFMYWDIIRRGAAEGYRLFDFGRSKYGTGAFAFKKNWGFEPTPLTYAFHLRHGGEPPEHNPLNPRYRLMIETWKRLPLGLANLLGPLIVRNLG
ncbi:MAG: FemAB family PEP-CTERM system-associated protein [Alphaproteobacteria bacterium]|nr:FemAB family PEP-CTERM system-associated protein [Alphaproteobacteria bacterium]